MAAGGEEPVERRERRLARVVAALRRTDTNPALVRAARATREMLPGDSRFGDELSTAGGRPTEILARHLVEVGEVRESASKELGLSALQVWQTISQSAGRGQGTEEVAILFTDLVGFSEWALEAGDEAALELLREVARRRRAGDHRARRPGGQAPGRRAHGGVRLRPGRGRRRLRDPRARGGDRGRGPRARSCARACISVTRASWAATTWAWTSTSPRASPRRPTRRGPGLLRRPSTTLDGEAHDAKRRRRFRAKGAPRDLEVYAVQPRR